MSSPTNNFLEVGCIYKTKYFKYFFLVTKIIKSIGYNNTKYYFKYILIGDNKEYSGSVDINNIEDTSDWIKIC